MYLLSLHNIKLSIRNGEATPTNNSVSWYHCPTEQKQLKHEHHARSYTWLGRQHSKHTLVQLELMKIHIYTSTYAPLFCL